MDNTIFRRKIYDEILEWKENRSDKYALLITRKMRPWNDDWIVSDPVVVFIPCPSITNFLVI